MVKQEDYNRHFEMYAMDFPRSSVRPGNPKVIKDLAESVLRLELAFCLPIEIFRQLEKPSPRR